MVCKKNGITEIVQCKRWARGKEIHEKHIYYLFGTAVEYYLGNNGTKNIQAALFASDSFATIVVPKLVITADISSKAEQVAKVLGVKVDKRPFQNYPSIKCNVSRVNGEKIYHLPFDQQYDTAHINDEELECFVSTINEAETQGFRHAYRWTGA